MESENILKKGGARIRHGSYRSVYLDNRGHGQKAWRADYQSVDAGGVVRLRKWFKNREDAVKWLYGF